MLFAKEATQEISESTVQAFVGLTVLIADDHHLVREGLKLSLKSMGQDITVIEADTLDSAVTAYQTRPDIDLVLLDLNMPGMREATSLDGFARRCPEARIVIVSATYDMQTVQAALSKGALGFIPKLAGKAAFLNALRFVIEGGIYIPPEALMPARSNALSASTASTAQILAATAAEGSTTGRSAALQGARLTARQIDVLAQLLDGKPNKQICRELNLALGTVKCHVGAILGVLEVNSRAEAIAAVNRRGWREWLEQPRVQSGQPA